MNIEYKKGWVEEKHKDNPEALHQKFKNPFIVMKGIFCESLEEDFQQIYEASAKKDKDGNEVYEQGWIEDKSSDPAKFHNKFKNTIIKQDMGVPFGVFCEPKESDRKNSIEPEMSYNNFEFKIDD